MLGEEQPRAEQWHPESFPSTQRARWILGASSFILQEVGEWA